MTLTLFLALMFAGSIAADLRESKRRRSPPARDTH